MYKYEKESIIKKLNSILHLNANNMDTEQCYYLCANKEKLRALLQHENQVIFGRRGTGKTTIFKAFSYYINNIYKEEDKTISCWYTRLDECIPHSIEVSSERAEDIVVISINKFLSKFVDFLIEDYKKIEAKRKFKNARLEQISEKLLAFSYLIKEGSKKREKTSESRIIHKKTSAEKDKELGITPSNQLNLFQWLKLQFKFKKVTLNEIGTTTEIDYIYSIDINEIKSEINELVNLMGYDSVYICIDEFTQIDRDFEYTIQPKVAQLLKELFFNSKTFIIKIASVWNLSRMQMRQLNGNREGLELGQDIFTNRELNLDIMFNNDNDNAYRFFKDVLVNNYLMYESPVSDRERDLLGNYIIEALFSQGSFRHLICGSQGIPRVFGILLTNCIHKLENRERDKITVEMVFESVIDNYVYDVRPSIPYSLPICSGIEEYVMRTKRRFFLLDINDYNKSINYFDGLVANNALHQCPSEQLPKGIRNKYKLFYTHYGNYLECFKDGITKLHQDTGKVGEGLLYPKMPENFAMEVEKYIFKLPTGALDKFYCTYCHKYFEKSTDNSNVTVCPECGRVIALWG
ncbi:hypothetical protein QA584_05240 [Anaerocolumna sp. AGMB13025]|uniref:hypothetical protein n=1 Tax=Anaerocolumna sp. AGMB13025 TaxID=3039116 RepID=UPI00241C2A44|nr:hypothetical protein [Anaerocolumna sp. AGMB13025]WFR58477.1 hypothetical protein QA584_05240 [Anaerocolumna sp. AGMB13025]